MRVAAAEIPDVKILEPRVFADGRGFFFESYNKRSLLDAGVEVDFVQDNHSRSRRDVLRGLHYQVNRPQGKLVRVVRGCVLDVAVDLRRSSSTFGRHVAVLLSARNRRTLWIPPGFAHGFVTRSASAEVIYKATNYYSPQDERSLLWKDPDLGIDWQLTRAPILSAKDEAGALLRDAEMYP